ncbi:NUDIX domain-containing protein [Qipengyuania huizhouensis]|uniref:NUDIX domain-containing protein n=1 Tax=Qipengyuania huizhouensis TaxID=2867245 RepID=UPI001C882814|nr:NUDIX domain-containing protein [Qipengyuania huizhouensis]MBX7460390.1 NUDIX domain-containing protein [Qipengyuania huizhouensis]
MNSNRKGMVEGLWVKFLHLLFRMSRGLTLGVRAVVVNEGGEVLLVRHTYTSGWHFPGGGVEPNEIVEDALARELKQETGLQLISSPKLHGIFFNHAVSKYDHVLVYICETQGEVSCDLLDLEISKVGYFRIGDLPEKIDPGTERRLKEIVELKKSSFVW